MISKEVFSDLVEVGAEIVKNIILTTTLKEAVEYDFDDYADEVECLGDVNYYLETYNMEGALFKLINSVTEITTTDAVNATDAQAIYKYAISLLGTARASEEDTDEIEEFITFSYKVLTTGKNFKKFNAMIENFGSEPYWVENNINL